MFYAEVAIRVCALSSRARFRALPEPSIATFAELHSNSNLIGRKWPRETDKFHEVYPKFISSLRMANVS
jgi:hypothetical protein